MSPANGPFIRRFPHIHFNLLPLSNKKYLHMFGRGYCCINVYVCFFFLLYFLFPLSKKVCSPFLISFPHCSGHCQACPQRVPKWMKMRNSNKERKSPPWQSNHSKAWNPDFLSGSHAFLERPKYCLLWLCVISGC